MSFRGERKEERKMTSPAGRLVPTARAATLGRAGRTTCRQPSQTSVFCRSGPGLVALVRTVGRPRRSTVKVGRKLEKRAHSGVHHWHTQAARLPHCSRQASDWGKESVRQARHRRRTAAQWLPRSISWFVLAARSRLACGSSRPPTTESPPMTGPSQEAPHQCRHSSVSRLVAALPRRRHLRSSRF